MHRLSNAIARRGHQVDVIHCRDACRVSPARKAALCYEDHPNVTVHGLKSRAGLIFPLITHQMGGPGLYTSHIRHILRKR